MTPVSMRTPSPGAVRLAIGCVGVTLALAGVAAAYLDQAPRTDRAAYESEPPPSPPIVLPVRNSPAPSAAVAPPSLPAAAETYAPLTLTMVTTWNADGAAAAKAAAHGGRTR